MEQHQLSILIIDPQTSDHELIRESLKRSKIPAELLFTTTSQEGLALIRKHRFDLVVTDHQLPQANAFHLLFEVQQTNPFLPVVLLTRDDEARTAREAFQRGVDDFILKEELEAISLFDVICNLIEKRRKKEEEAAREIKLREQAERDGLTGLYNHRYFLEALDREYERARRYRRPLSLLMLDLDGFKALNDTYGHQKGDQALEQIAKIILHMVRFVDIVARYGGDEFVIILPETDLKSAARIGNRLLNEIQKNSKIFPLAASIGIAGFHKNLPSTGAFLKEADDCLYEAKKNGRNRVVTTQQSWPASIPLEMLNQVPLGKN